MDNLIEIKDIIRDPELQNRVQVDPATVKEYAEIMADTGWGDFPPVNCVKDGDRYWLWDGFQRVEAATQVGIRRVPVKWLAGDRELALWYSLSANGRHGLRRTAADKRRSIENALFHFPQRSDRELAYHLSVSHPTVAKVREELEATGKVSSQTARVGQDGRTINTANIGSSQSYVEIWQLEQAITAWLPKWCQNESEKIDGLAAIKIKSAQGLELLETLMSRDILPGPRRKSDVIQACNNILQRLKESDFKRQRAETIQTLVCLDCGLTTITAGHMDTISCECGRSWTSTAAYKAEQLAVAGAKLVKENTVQMAGHWSCGHCGKTYPPGPRTWVEGVDKPVCDECLFRLTGKKREAAAAAPLPYWDHYKAITGQAGPDPAAIEKLKAEFDATMDRLSQEAGLPVREDQAGRKFFRGLSNSAKGGLELAIEQNCPNLAIAFWPQNRTEAIRVEPDFQAVYVCCAEGEECACIRQWVDKAVDEEPAVAGLAEEPAEKCADCGEPGRFSTYGRWTPNDERICFNCYLKRIQPDSPYYQNMFGTTGLCPACGVEQLVSETDFLHGTNKICGRCGQANRLGDWKQVTAPDCPRPPRPTPCPACSEPVRKRIGGGLICTNCHKTWSHLRALRDSVTREPAPAEKPETSGGSFDFTGVTGDEIAEQLRKVEEAGLPLDSPYALRLKQELADRQQLAETSEETYKQLLNPTNYRQTPPGQPTVADIAKIDHFCRTNYSSGGRIIRCTRSESFGQAVYTVAYVGLDQKPRKDGTYGAAAGWINDLVAVDGRILKLYKDNIDEVFVFTDEQVARADQELINRTWHQYSKLVHRIHPARLAEFAARLEEAGRELLSEPEQAVQANELEAEAVAEPALIN